MSSISIIKKVLQEWDKNRILYCILRNYEFLFDPHQEAGYDLDIVLASAHAEIAEQILLQQGFTKYPLQFSKKHHGFGIYVPEERCKLGFDLQIGGIHWNDMVYLSETTIFPRRKIQQGVSLLSPEDEFVMYLCHSLLGKRYFKEKYQQKIIELLGPKLDLNYVRNILEQSFSSSVAEEIMNKTQQHDFKGLTKKSKYYLLHFLEHKPRRIGILLPLFFRWLNWQRFGQSYPLISIIGPDGSGKTTAAQELFEVLQQSRRSVSLIYSGRGKSNFLPIKTIAGWYKKKEKQQEEREHILSNSKKSFKINRNHSISSTIIQKIVYSLAAPVYTLDLLLRYYLLIFPRRKLRTIVITDRYCSDILLMPHVPWTLRRFLLSLFPKPTLCFYLHNDARVLYERRKQQSVSELEQQMKLFSYLSHKFKAISIETTNIEKDVALIQSKVFHYFMKKRY